MENRREKYSATEKQTAPPRPARIGLFIAAALLLGACAMYEPEAVRQSVPADINISNQQDSASIFTSDPYADGRSIGVNSFLWRASLDTISFMPVTSSDPFGGVILTDWYSSDEAPNERFKLNVYIMSRTLRANGVRVAVFRQVLEPSVGWRDMRISDNTATKIEDSILTRARQLRNEVLQIQ